MLKELKKKLSMYDWLHSIKDFLVISSLILILGIEEGGESKMIEVKGKSMKQ